MRNRVRFVLIPIFGLIMAVAAGSAVYASNNATWTTQFSVALATSLVNNTAFTDFGTVIPGQQSGAVDDSLTITSNDPAGVQLQASSPSASYPEVSITTCTPNAARTVPASSVQLQSAATTGGAGSAGIGTVINLSTTNQNLFLTVPTATGTLSETVQGAITAPAATKPNTPGCAYQIPVNYTLIAQ